MVPADQLTTLALTAPKNTEPAVAPKPDPAICTVPPPATDCVPVSCVSEVTAGAGAGLPAAAAHSCADSPGVPLALVTRGVPSPLARSYPGPARYCPPPPEPRLSLSPVVTSLNAAA